MASTFSKLRHDLADDLEDQVAALRKEVASLRRSASKRGSWLAGESRDYASDIYDDLLDRLSDAWPIMRKRSRDVGRVATDHPVTTAVVGLAVIGLAIGFFARR
jgi:ElaB/YqjD/DUF883 family membrane-anchored ribosome-binding protein